MIVYLSIPFSIFPFCNMNTAETNCAAGNGVLGSLFACGCDSAAAPPSIMQMKLREGELLLCWLRAGARVLHFGTLGSMLSRPELAETKGCVGEAMKISYCLRIGMSAMANPMINHSDTNSQVAST